MSDIPGIPDIRGLELTRALPLQSSVDSPAERAKVATLAQEFEAMLLLQMVRQMRHSLLSEEERDTGFGGETMTETFDAEFARYLSQAGGLGLARIVSEQVTARAAASADATANGDTANSDAATGTDASSVTPSSPVTKPMPPASTGAPPPAASLASAVAPLTPEAAEAVAPSSPLAAAAELAQRARTLAASTRAVSLDLPLDGVTSSPFGWRADPLHGARRFHSGVDLKAAYGTTVEVAAPGTVTFAGERGGYGLTVVVSHGNGVETRYAHLSSIDVREGQPLDASAVVGRVGQSGRATGPHLHFEVLVDGERVDPARSHWRTSGELKSGAFVVDSPDEWPSPDGRTGS